jgi:acyl-CoA hydrolase
MAMTTTDMTDNEHLSDCAEEYRELALSAVHGHQREYVGRRRLPQDIREWLRDGIGTIDEPVLAMLTELQALRVLEVLEAVDLLQDRSGADPQARGARRSPATPDAIIGPQRGPGDAERRGDLGPHRDGVNFAGEVPLAAV